MANALYFFVGYTNEVNYKLRPYVMAGISFFAIFSGNLPLQACGILLAIPTFYIFKMRS